MRTGIAKHSESTIAIRRHLHSHPELSYEEKETSAYIESKLKEWNIPFHKGVGGYGVVGHIGSSNHKLVALRGDMDALPIQEESDVPYKSLHAGVMHACGHDVHTTCLLAAAQYLKEIEKEIEGGIRLIFQPAEERLPGGASLMIADQVLKNPDVELIFGQHVYPDMEVGKVGFRSGKYMASADEIYITVHGKGGHGALPHTCIDPVVISAHLITALQQMVSRRSSPIMPTVLTFGKLEANGATNVIPDKVVMQGTMRTFDESWRMTLHGLIQNLVVGLCESMGATVELEIKKGYPSLVNNPELTEWSKGVAVDLLGEANVEELDLRMTAEDFAYFAQAVPACFYRLGTSNKSKHVGAPLHTSRFDVDESCLEIGASLMASLALGALTRL